MLGGMIYEIILFPYQYSILFPFISIPKWLNLEESIRFLAKENKNRESKHGEVIK